MGHLTAVIDPNAWPVFDDMFNWFYSRGHTLDLYNWKANIILPNIKNRILCALQDPVSNLKIRRLEKQLSQPQVQEMINNPYSMNYSHRCTAYPIWGGMGIKVPSYTFTYNYDRIKKEADYPYLLKELSKQYGKCCLITDEDKLDWIELESKKFDPDNMKRPTIIKFVDTKYKDGYYRLWRYLIIDKYGIPCYMGKSKNYKCKWSTTITESKKPHYNRDSLIEENFDFMQKECPSILIEAVKTLGLDFAMADITFFEGIDEFILWEINPYPDMPSKKYPLYRERIWPMMEWFFFDKYNQPPIPNFNYAKEHALEVKKEFNNCLNIESENSFKNIK